MTQKTCTFRLTFRCLVIGAIGTVFVSSAIRAGAGGGTAEGTPSAPPAKAAGQTEARVATSVTTPHGLLQIAIPSGWEMNPRLAEDNGVLAFMNPTGMKVGQDLPAWLLADHRAKLAGETFPTSLQRILAEGKAYGFALRDSMTVAIASGGTLVQYGFQPSKEGFIRAISFLDAGDGLLVFRSQVKDADALGEYGAAIQSILQGLRFTPAQKEQQAPPKG